jgi:hypothetical protein
MIYDGDPFAQLRRIASIAAEHLLTNYRCLYLNSPSMASAFQSCLSDAGVNTTEAVQGGALVLSSDQGHLVDGMFDSERMLAKLRTAVRQASADGFAGLWASGDMLWEFGSEKSLPKLLAYEVGVEALLEQEPTFHAVCQYHRDTLPVNAVQVALYTHRAVYANEARQSANPHYRNLRTLRRESSTAAAHVTEMLGSLRG